MNSDMAFDIHMGVKSKRDEYIFLWFCNVLCAGHLQVVSNITTNWQTARIIAVLRVAKGASMGLSKIMHNDPALTGPDKVVLEALKLMASKTAGAVIVASAEMKVQGIFTECDNARRVTLLERDPKAITLAQVMTAPVVTAAIDSSVDDALSTMVRNRFGYLPVVDADHRIVGIVSVRDMLMRRIGEKEAALQTLEAFASAGGPG